MPVDRARVRNVFIYNIATGEYLGGMRQNGSVTEAVFLWILNHILLITDAELQVKARASQQIILPTSNRLEPGDYDVYCNGTIELTNEPWVQRILSHSVSGREDSLRDGLRVRDGKCVLSGFPNLNADIGDWSPFEGAHIFPLEKEGIWIKHNFGRWITDIDYTNGVSKINSCQNGLLIRRDLHTMFDNYLISVNPDDGYKIIVFNRDIFGLDGRVLDPVCRNPGDPHRVADELLRWHFRQSVLANMRGAGEPIFEHDFPPGTDMMREIREGPSAQERFEMEIASRLRAFEV
ncbi:HNH endonuclease [Lipomyces kononenkoae]|uniref:HNH endonuclease n=1 Tax=Lipomyces kononenkoae TaxID=34357 RepID=A0ACC3SZW0_LIPKO